MKHTLLLTTLLGTAVLATPGAAASCMILSATLVTCDAPDSAPVSSDADNLFATINAGAGITSDDKDTSPLEVSGNNVLITNAGTLTNTDTSNNTNGIEISGQDVVINNSGTIRSGDRAIHAVDGDGNIRVFNTGSIFARRQAVRNDSDLAMLGFSVLNTGLIESTDGRAIQARSFGTSVTNFGILYGGEEVIEARDGFSLFNGTNGLIEVGTFTRDEAGNVVSVTRKDDEDGVQFASGTVTNLGTIIATDDGIDLDEGVITNGIDGEIKSRAADTSTSAAAIDIDGAFDNGRDDLRSGTNVEITNLGLLEGPRAITSAYDPDLADDDVAQSRQTIQITNAGTIIGRGGQAIALAPTQGDTMLNLLGANRIEGDVLLGGGDDTLRIETLTSGIIGDGLFDGGMGTNTVALADYLLSDIQSFANLGSDIFELKLQTAGGVAQARFTNWNFWSFSDESLFTTAELDARFNVSAIPLPAGMFLMLGALGGLGLLRRRRAA